MHDLPKSRDSPMRLGERYGKTEYRVVGLYNDGVVQAVTLAYLIEIGVVIY